MALMQISVIPVGTGNPSVGDYVAEIEIFLKKKGVEHSLNDMGTVITGTTEELLQLSIELHRLPFSMGAQRVVTNITLDERLDKERKIGEKQASVFRRLKERESS